MIKLKDLLEKTYFSTDKTIKPDYDSPVDSDKETPEPTAHELYDSIVQYASGQLNPSTMKKRVLRYKLLGGALEDIFHVVKDLDDSVQKDVMRDIQNFYLEGQKFTRSGWRRNDLREAYAVGTLQLKGSDNAIYITIDGEEFLKLGILDKFSNMKSEAWIYADEIDKLIAYLERAKAELTDDVVQKPHTSTLRQGF